MDLKFEHFLATIFAHLNLKWKKNEKNQLISIKEVRKGKGAI